jgi:cell wall-associated NlpC family hydrolase
MYRARDAQLQAAIRSLSMRQGSPGGGFGGGSPMSGMGGSPTSMGGGGMNAPLPPAMFTGGQRGSGPSPANGIDAANAAALPQDAGARAAAAALSQRGTPYVWGGETPGRGFDCSGLTQYAWRQAGVGLPRDTYGQITQGHPVPPGQVRPGDLIFPTNAFGEGGRPGPGHVMMAISPTQCVEAQQTGVPVKISAMPAAYVARRPIPS